MNHIFIHQLHQDTERLQQSLSLQKDFESKINHIRKYLFGRYLSKYDCRQAKLDRLLQGHGGNCEAQTKLMIHIIESLNLSFPRESILGVQQFQDHVQPVIYNTKTKEVWDLISGQRTTQIKAPIYAPPVLLHAYVVGQNISPVISIKELLIIDSKAEQECCSTDYRSNSSLQFVGGRGRFSKDPVPEYAHLEFQENEAEQPLNFLQRFKLWLERVF